MRERSSALPELLPSCDPALEARLTRNDAPQIQARLDMLLPAIVVSRRSEFYIAGNAVTGFRPQPFSPLAGAIMNVDVTK